MEKKITVRLEDELYKDFKKKLVDNDEKMKDVIARLIRDYLKEK